MDKSELEQLINEIYNVYQLDLTSKQDLKNVIRKWVHKCSCFQFNQPINIFDCFKTVKKEFLTKKNRKLIPNIYKFIELFIPNALDHIITVKTQTV